MQRRNGGITDQLGIKGQHRCHLIAAAVKLNAQKLNIGHAFDQPRQHRVTPRFHHLNRFGTAPLHSVIPIGRSSVKAPAPIATGRLSSSSVAVTRTKATERVT